MFMSDSFPRSLELDFRPESENDCVVRASAHICKVLNEWLQKEHRQRVQESVELQAVLGLEPRRARRVELLAQAVVHVADGHGVVKFQRQRLIEAQSGGEHGVVAVGVCRTPVVRERAIQTFSVFRIETPESLARHPVQEVIPLLRFRARRRRELSGIVVSAELIEAGVSFSALDIVKGPHGRRFLPRSESNLGNAHGYAAKLWNESQCLFVGGPEVIFGESDGTRTRAASCVTGRIRRIFYQFG
jgi:hypothetical protein